MLAAADRLMKDEIRVRMANDASERTKIIALDLENQARLDAAQIEFVEASNALKGRVYSMNRPLRILHCST